MNEKPDQLEEFVPENLRRAEQPMPRSKPANIGLLVALVVLVVGVIVAGLLSAVNALGEMNWEVSAEFIGFLFLIVIGVPLYFLPCILAGRQHRNFSSIAVINLFLGWTLVGWVAALAWAVYRDKPER